MTVLTLAILTGLALPALAGEADPPAQFFATRIVEFAPGDGHEFFPDSTLALGGPRGATVGSGSLDVVSLGVQGELVLGFAPGEALTDRPGEDLIVFENAILTSGTHHFAELVRVGVSTNGVDYAFFPTWCGLTAPPVQDPYLPIDVTQVSGFAGVTPVLADVGGPSEPGNSVNPFDPAAAGGDAFDLTELVEDPLVVGGAVDLERIYFVKLVDVLGDGSETDDFENPIYDPSGRMYRPPPEDYPNSADIDAIAGVHGLAAPIIGDANRDGRVGLADLMALADNYGLATGAVWEHGDFNVDGAVGLAALTDLADHYGRGGQVLEAVPEQTGLILTALWLAATGGLRRRIR